MLTRINIYKPQELRIRWRQREGPAIDEGEERLDLRWKSRKLWETVGRARRDGREPCLAERERGLCRAKDVKKTSTKKEERQKGNV